MVSPNQNRGSILFSDPSRTTSKRIVSFIIFSILMFTLPGWPLLLAGYLSTNISLSERVTLIHQGLIIIFIALVIGIITGWGTLLNKPVRVREKGIEWPLPWPIPNRRDYVFIPYEEIISIYLDLKENGTINKKFDGPSYAQWPTGMVITIKFEYAKVIYPFNPGGHTKLRFSGKYAEIFIPYIKAAMGMERWNKLITTDKGAM